MDIGSEQEPYIDMIDTVDSNTHRSHTIIENVPTYTSTEIEAFLAQEEFLDVDHDSVMVNHQGGNQIPTFTQYEIKQRPGMYDQLAATASDESDVTAYSELHLTQCEYAIVKQEPVGVLPASNCFEIRLQSANGDVDNISAADNIYTRSKGDTNPAYAQNQVYPLALSHTAGITVDAGPYAETDVCTDEPFDRPKPGREPRGTSQRWDEQCDTAEDGTHKPGEFRTHDGSVLNPLAGSTKVRQDAQNRCDSCGYEAISERALQIHYMTHTSHTQTYDTALKCSQCKCMSTRLNIVEQHKHGEKTLFTLCPQCGNTPATSSQLADYSSTYVDAKPHRCTQCPYQCKRAYNLKQHMLTHSDTKQYKCVQCPYQSKRAYGLKQHMKSHSGMGQYKCVQCPYQSKRAYDLKQHMLTHCEVRQYKCMQCQYQSKRAYDLRQHMMAHRGIGQHKCMQCSFQSKRAYNLRQHMLTHREDVRMHTRTHSNAHGAAHTHVRDEQI